jgi:hypothetical protein
MNLCSEKSYAADIKAKRKREDNTTILFQGSFTIITKITIAQAPSKRLSFAQPPSKRLPILNHQERDFSLLKQ